MSIPKNFADVPLGGPATGPRPSSTTEGTYSDFGTDVEIEEPPASEVTEQPGM